MEGVEDFLKFTMETGEDFEGGWFPKPDTSLTVGEGNQILYKFFKNEMSSKKTIQTYQKWRRTQNSIS